MHKILVVEDKLSMSQLMVRFLENKFEVITKEDGLQAISWLQLGNIPDIILTDLQMPNLDGIELIKRIKESGYFNDIPIIVLSSQESSNVRVECLKLGAQDYIMKPFNPEELMIRIERLIK